MRKNYRFDIYYREDYEVDNFFYTMTEEQAKAIREIIDTLDTVFELACVEVTFTELAENSFKEL